MATPQELYQNSLTRLSELSAERKAFNEQMLVQIRDQEQQRQEELERQKQGGVRKFFSGALGGAGLGAALGSVFLPGIGTAIGAGLGGLAAGTLAGTDKSDAGVGATLNPLSSATMATSNIVNSMNRSPSRLDALANQASTAQPDYAAATSEQPRQDIALAMPTLPPGQSELPVEHRLAQANPLTDPTSQFQLLPPRILR